MRIRGQVRCYEPDLIIVKEDQAIFSYQKFWREMDVYNSGYYVLVIQLRLNLIPVKSMPSIDWNDQWCRCRGCGYQRISNVIQRCSVVLDYIIERHNLIQKRIEKAAKKASGIKGQICCCNCQRRRSRSSVEDISRLGERWKFIILVQTKARKEMILSQH